MSDKRRLARKVANIILEISDHNTGSRLGQVVNVTTEGLLLISKKPIAVDAVFQMDMHLNESVGDVEKITFGATALWSSPARQAESYWTGFHIIDISPETSAIIEQMVNDWETEGCDSGESGEAS